MSVHLRVYAELTVKDVVEAAGIPHTEVDLLVNGESVDFDHRPRHGDRIIAYPVFESLPKALPTDSLTALLAALSSDRIHGGAAIGWNATAP